jgi:hypothetical protein
MLSVPSVEVPCHNLLYICFIACSLVCGCHNLADRSTTFHLRVNLIPYFIFVSWFPAIIRLIVLTSPVIYCEPYKRTNELMPVHMIARPELRQFSHRCTMTTDDALRSKTLCLLMKEGQYIQTVPQWNRQISPACLGDHAKQKISYKPWVDSASLSRYGPKWLFALVMVLSTRTPIIIAMSNPPLHFC